MLNAPLRPGGPEPSRPAASDPARSWPVDKTVMSDTHPLLHIIDSTSAAALIAVTVFRRGSEIAYSAMN